MSSSSSRGAEWAGAGRPTTRMQACLATTRGGSLPHLSHCSHTNPAHPPPQTPTPPLSATWAAGRLWRSCWRSGARAAPRRWASSAARCRRARPPRPLPPTRHPALPLHSIARMCCLQRAASALPAAPPAFATPCPPCTALQDVDTYTSGWPASRTPGQPDLFKLVRRVLPGPVSARAGAGTLHAAGFLPSAPPAVHCTLALTLPCIRTPARTCSTAQYTFILPASKELPKAITAVDKGGRAKRRHEVGVRLPDDPGACLVAVLERRWRGAR